MDVSETIAIALLVFYLFLGFVTHLLNRKQAQIIKLYEKYFEDESRFNKVLFEYCMNDIKKRAIEAEDYELAARVSELLKMNENHNTKTPTK